MPIPKRYIGEPSASSSNNILTNRDNNDIQIIFTSMRSIGQLASYAAEIFDGLSCLAKEFNERIDSASTRSRRLLGKISRIPVDHIARISKEAASPELLYSNPKPTLIKKSASRQLQERYQQCRIRPQLWKLSQFNGTDPLEFSNPGFVFNEWLKCEQRRQQEENAKASARKALKKQLKQDRKERVQEYSAILQNALEAKSRDRLMIMDDSALHGLNDDTNNDIGNEEQVTIANNNETNENPNEFVDNDANGVFSYRNFAKMKSSLFSRSNKAKSADRNNGDALAGGASGAQTGATKQSFFNKLTPFPAVPSERSASPMMDAASQSLSGGNSVVSHQKSVSFQGSIGGKEGRNARLSHTSVTLGPDLLGRERNGSMTRSKGSLLLSKNAGTPISYQVDRKALLRDGAVAVVLAGRGQVTLLNEEDADESDVSSLFSDVSYNAVVVIPDEYDALFPDDEVDVEASDDPEGSLEESDNQSSVV